MRRIPDFLQAMRLSMTPCGSTADETPRRRYRPHFRGRDRGRVKTRLRHIFRGRFKHSVLNIAA